MERCLQFYQLYERTFASAAIVCKQVTLQYAQE